MFSKALRIVEATPVSHNIRSFLKQNLTSQHGGLIRGTPLGAKWITTTTTSSPVQKSALFILADGADEVETVTTIDVLRNSNINVVVAGVAGDDAVKCFNGAVLKPDKGLKELLDEKEPAHFDAVIVTGGPAAKTLAESAAVGKLLQTQDAEHGLIGAICSGPTVLRSHAIGLGRKITAHPSAKPDLQGEYKFTGERVSQDSNIVTAQASGSAVDFALKLVENIQGRAIMQNAKARFKVEPTSL